MATKPKQMACLTIGYSDFLVPMETAVKMVQAMTDAFLVDKDFDRNSGDVFYTVEERRPRVEMAAVRPEQVQFPEGHQTRPAPAARRLTQ